MLTARSISLSFCSSRINLDVGEQNVEPQEQVFGAGRLGYHLGNPGSVHFGFLKIFAESGNRFTQVQLFVFEAGLGLLDVLVAQDGQTNSSLPTFLLK